MAGQPLSPATNRRLGGPLPHQLANWTRAHLSADCSFYSNTMPYLTLCGISTPFGALSPSVGQIAHALLTRPPLENQPKSISSFDLHVLSTPPAFVLSQDQTLMFNPSLNRFQMRQHLSTVKRFSLNFLESTVSLLVRCSLYRFQGSLPFRSVSR